MATNLVSRTIVELNNGALSHFLRGDYDQAIVILRMTYDRFQSHRIIEHNPYCCVVNSPQHPLPNGPQSPCAGYNVFVQYGDQTGGRKPETTSGDLDSVMMDCDDLSMPKSQRSVLRVEPTCSFASSPGTAHSMYNRALVLSTDQDDDSMLRIHQQRTQAIILYNLGLVHHNIGMHLGVSTALWNALRLYEMALESIDGDANVADIQKLLLALLNNKGNIHAHLFHFDNTEACMKNLGVVLAASVSAMALDEDYLFFFWNSIYQGKELCFAPAA